MAEVGSQRGGYPKKPVEPKCWTVEAMSSGKQRVVLGRFLTEAEALVDLARIKAEGYYTQARVVQTKPPPAPPPQASPDEPAKD